jgi:L-ribulose-5-phosphate 4-epimerase
MIDEGYIKFNISWENKPAPIPHDMFAVLEKWRSKLYRRKLVGIYDDGIGFGNISSRYKLLQFFITGSATGHKEKLLPYDYALVTSWSIEDNMLNCLGETKASSESLSHAVLYVSNENIGSVIHVHSKEMWEHYRNVLPTTNKEVSYGTPEMAGEIFRLLHKDNFPDSGMIVMGGHEEGILVYGPTLDDAGKLLLEHFTSL